MAHHLFQFKSHEIVLGRRLNREGKSIKEIQEALGWDCHLRTTEDRFRRIGIKLSRDPNRKRAHEGGLTTMGKESRDQGRNDYV